MMLWPGGSTLCRKSATPARQKTAKSGRPTLRNRKLYHYLWPQRRIIGDYRLTVRYEINSIQASQPS